MELQTEGSLLLIDQGAASRALPGQDVCGDSHLVKPTRGGFLFGVMDGLGHGAEAVAAASAARAALQRHAEEPLIELVQRCHEELRNTRGVVMTLARLSTAGGFLTWLGIGNVEAALVRADSKRGRPLERVFLRSGIVGYQLPVLHPSEVPVARGDLLVFATDGIGAGFAEGLSWDGPAQRVADDILKRHFRGTDDALVLAVRYNGRNHE